ncbi:MAG TPA: VOC family protein [bacterium]|nr:VOC family protein [bacterium]
MIDHLILHVRDAARSKQFFLAALQPLGIGVAMEFGGSVGLGAGGKPVLWIAPGATHGNSHLAFTAPDRKTVDAFHRAAVAAGGKDNGGPGLRPHYHASYYAAFVLDPDGNNIEAVCHAPA